jgi:DNA-binding NarL/FixJ family response regulator
VLNHQETDLEGPTIRVLVVDDFQPFRLFVCSTLQKRPEFHVIYEASDGLEAVERAQELRPDVIVLDIGLPRLNGIEAARRIRELSSGSRILFVSQESSADVVEEALSLGAWGYVVKAHAGSELLTAVEAVCRGKRFIGSGLSGHHVAEPVSVETRDRSGRKDAFGTLRPRKGATRVHEVEFYPDDESLLTGFTGFMEAALKAQNSVILIATESRRMRLQARLQARGWDLARILREGTFISLDAADTLSKFMVNDWPNSALLLKLADDLILEATHAAQREHPRVVACGECAPTLWAQGKIEAAIELEHLWDNISGSYDIDTLCGYVWPDFERAENSHLYERLLREHSVAC